MSDLPVADSSVWLEWFTDGPRADTAAMILDAEVHVPVIVYYEVYKWMLRSRGLQAARQAAAQMVARSGARGVAPLDAGVAVIAATLCVDERPRMGMGDALVVAHARHVRSVAVSFDRAFHERAGAVWFPLTAADRAKYPDPVWPPGGG